MRQLLLSFIVCIGLAGSAVAQSREITGTIDAQIEAFQNDDLVRAFSYASPGIRQVFQTPESFGAMVRGGFPMVWRPAEVQYLELREVAGNLWQKVRITDAAGRVHVLDYQMVNLESIWKINAVQILDVPESTV
ncbi:DUF4864 domain-containing protein [Sedimentitalea todarodis]|uniref:DUF4864 domain-containing protein n=1 Tax=Sedimentitalea todarodis TaxID=1631240 RepID=A0ABU3VFK8_9RHOB|nr:DUF4864 domain-containing protein [Sedimentitalea todarodis]MDU9004961.1 DUF4864 domain-containing protein [Sedimentitalea todarodis]